MNNEHPSPFDRSLETYVKHLQGRNVSLHTITAYRTDLSQFFRWILANDGTVAGPTGITRAHIIDYLSFLAGQGRSGVTRARKLASIREYGRFLVAEQLIERSPAEGISMPKKERADRPQTLDPHLFLNYQGTQLSVRGVMDIVEKYRRSAGITKKFSCHSLRHTCATYKAAKEYTVRQLQALLGHEKAETSLLYTHLAETDGRKLMEQTSL